MDRWWIPRTHLFDTNTGIYMVCAKGPYVGLDGKMKASMSFASHFSRFYQFSPQFNPYANLADPPPTYLAAKPDLASPILLI